MVREADLELTCLPPYSPDNNPIETKFDVLKASMRRNQATAILFAEQ